MLIISCVVAAVGFFLPWSTTIRGSYGNEQIIEISGYDAANGFWIGGIQHGEAFSFLFILLLSVAIVLLSIGVLLFSGIERRVKLSMEISNLILLGSTIVACAIFMTDWGLQHSIRIGWYISVSGLMLSLILVTTIILQPNLGESTKRL